MKKFILSTIIALAIAIPSFAATPQYDQDLVNTTGLTTSKNYTQNLMNGMQIDYLSYQAVYSTETYAAISSISADINLGNIIVTTVTYPTAFAVIYSSALQTLQNNLTHNATYYVIPVSAGYISLATTKANAVAGTAIIISTGGAGTFTLKPSPQNGVNPFYIVWKASNDGINWTNLTASSVTVFGSSTANSTLWDFGFTTYKYIRAAITAADFGSLKLKIKGYGKRVNP